jgi:hypothetical protein
MWNPCGFGVIGKLQNDIKMNGEYFVTYKLCPIEQAIFSRGMPRHQKRLVVHFDNCSVHTRKGSAHWLEEYGVFHMPYPFYSPDLAPSDFYLFPTVKQKLENIQVVDDDEFLIARKSFWRILINKN